MVLSSRSGAIFRIFTETGKTYVESAKFDNSFDMQIYCFEEELCINSHLWQTTLIEHSLHFESTYWIRMLYLSQQSCHAMIHGCPSAYDPTGYVSLAQHNSRVPSDSAVVVCFLFVP